ncbi:hypothetical protein [Thauera sinica]|uniref:HMA domain-containing protein n=1 Tax=Thauera sinica TaxID=2665146 RepID=A0ABW1AM23_9RHOO|nr:hypothetical protein [Thauera sp. K11]ATE60855.1 hypothetical protein CCZ27_13690 [Thauera sp. K11]
MRRETAYKLAGRHHEHRARGTGLIKQRELRFKPTPPGQHERAWRALSMLEGVEVERTGRELALTVRYSVLDHSLEALEDALREAGFALDDSLYMKLVRALVYFTEETQRHNLVSPERLIKQSHEVYIQAWSHHVHGDHDDTPPELREYR